MNRKNYRIVLLGWLSLIAFSVMGATPQEALDRLLGSTSLTKDKTGILVYELATGRTVVAYNDGMPLVPASVMKAVTAASFTDKFKYADKLKTDVFTTGRISDGTLTGNLVIVGGGDPSLGREPGAGDLAEEIAEALYKKGITAIRGGLTFDKSFIGGTPTPSHWPAGDLTQYYGTGYHAFNYQGNARGKAAVSNPDQVFKSDLLKALQKRGITMTGEEVEEGKRTLLLSHASPQLTAILRACLFRSDNLYAEGLLRLFGKKMGTDGSTEDSAEVQMQHLRRKGYPMNSIRVTDGSGLSRDNRLTADFLGEVLGDKSEDPVFVSLFPLVGEEGTVKSFMKDTPLSGRMALKTGSMSGIQSYAGYMLDENFEPTHVVVVITNELKDRSRFRKELGDFFVEIFAQ